MSVIGTSLGSAFDYTWGRFTERLTGLEDDEYFWEPVPGCWTIHQDADGRWEPEGPAEGEPEPDPPPLTTIAWRVAHIGGPVLGGFTDLFFGEGLRSPEALTLPGTAEGALGFLEANYRAWREGIATLGDERWWQPLGPNWGPYAEDNTVDLTLHVLDELVHHAAEVSLLRDLYLRRDELGRR